jgi:AAA15 family ATPase/GTPase
VELSGFVRYPEDKTFGGVVPVAAIYGSNASGKTKLLNTLHDIAQDIKGASYDKAKQSFSISPFMELTRNRGYSNCAMNEGEISYEINVALSDAEYLFSYTIDECGIKDEILSKRLLNSFNKMDLIYHRQKSEFLPEGLLSLEDGFDDIRSSFDKNVLWLNTNLQDRTKAGFGRRYHFGELTEWLLNIDAVLSFNESTSNEEKHNIIVAKVISDSSFKKRLLSFLYGLDNSITNITFEQTISDRLNLVISHRMKIGDEIVTANLPFKNESAGTQKLIEKFYLIDIALETGMPFICDELDSSLHPVAFRQIVDLFNSERNINNAQLIFTAHDTIAMDSNRLRPDEVYIISKNEYGASCIERLSERKDIEPYPYMERDFRHGFYGSYPEGFLKKYQINGERNGKE